MRKIVMTGLVAVALLGCAGPALAEAGSTGNTGTATATAGGQSAKTDFLREIAARYPATSVVGRAAAAYLGRPSGAQPAAASAATTVATEGTGISCASPTACLSVGVRVVSSSSSLSITPIAARLHAGTWKAVPFKAPKGTQIALPTGVSCKAATYCIVLGVTLPTAGDGVGSFALRWDGTTLTPIAAPPMPAHTVGSGESLSCVAVGKCVSIGSATNQTTGVNTQLVWTWNGSTWARTALPGASASTDTEFGAMHCVSATSCVAVADEMDLTGDGADTPEVLAWNGTSLTDLHATMPAKVSEPFFNGVSCVSAHSCTVVGGGSTSSTGDNAIAFAEVWNGSTWAVTKWSGPKGDTEADLDDVSCTSAARCIAVGDQGTDRAQSPAALAWTGSKWTVLKVAGPGAGKAAVFTGISCPVNGKCLTTGAVGAANGPSATMIAGSWNGSAWKYGPVPVAAA